MINTTDLQDFLLIILGIVAIAWVIIKPDLEDLDWDDDYKDDDHE